MCSWIDEEVEHTLTAAAVVAAVVASKVAGRTLDVQDYWVYSCEFGPLKRSADALDVEMAEGMGSESGEADVETASDSFVAESVAETER